VCYGWSREFELSVTSTRPGFAAIVPVWSSPSRWQTRPSPGYWASHFMNHIEKWVEFINICKAPNIEIILELVFSIYSSNAYIERVFSIMKNICSDDRFKLWTANLKAKLCVKINYNFKCSQFYYYIKNNDKLLKSLQIKL
jgi:hypothetical protein